MTDAAFQSLIARLVAAGGVFLRSGGVHVEADCWRALDADSQRALVARRDDIRELLASTSSDTVEGSSEDVPEVPDGLCSRRSRGGNANDDGANGRRASERVATVSPDIEDSASRDGSSTASERDGSTGHESAIEQGVESAEAAEGAVTARADSEGAGDVATSDRPSAGNVAASEGESNENSGIDSVNAVSKGAPGRVQAGTKIQHSANRRYTSRYRRHGNSLVDVESFEWFSRRYHRSNERELDRVRRDAERDFGMLGEMRAVDQDEGFAKVIWGDDAS